MANTSDLEPLGDLPPRHCQQPRETGRSLVMKISLLDSSPGEGSVERIDYVPLVSLLTAIPPVPGDRTVFEERPNLNDFLTSPGAGNLVIFEVDGAHLAMKVIPWRSTPVFVTRRLDARPVKKDRFEAAFPVLKRAWSLQGFHWSTPEFLEICSELGLPSRYEAPEFRIGYGAVCWALLDWDAATDGLPIPTQAVITSYKVRDFVFDVLDVLRTDAHRGKQSPPEVLATFETLRPELIAFGVPCLDQIEALLNHPEQLGITDAGAPSYTSVRFLPSYQGRGFQSTIRGWEADHASDGWQHAFYHHLEGVAALPSEKDLAECPWLRTCVRRLRSQGVLFLNDEDGQAYLRDEGTYWRWLSGDRSGVSAVQNILWRIHKPETPIGDRARKMALTARGAQSAEPRLVLEAETS